MYNSVKSFGQFLIEALKTAASTEAKLKGLKGDGHGGWYDAKGKFVAKTVNGKLQFTGGGGAAAPEDPKSRKVLGREEHPGEAGGMDENQEPV